MKYYRLLYLLLLSSMSCAVTQSLVLDAVWENPVYEPREFGKVAIFGLAKNFEHKRAFEDDAVKYLNAKGVPAVAGYTLYDHEPSGDEVNRSDIKSHLFSLGFDGVLTASPIENISTDDQDISNEELETHARGLYKFGQYFESRYDHLQSDVDHNHHKYSVLEANFYALSDYSEFDNSGLVWISHFKYDLEKKIPEKMEIDQYAHVVINGLFEDQVILEKKK